jgi:hypothetical protein
VIMAALGYHLVRHPVADPLEEDLVGSCGNAGGALALDSPSYHLLGQSRGGAAKKRHEHHHHGYHHRYFDAHLFLLPSEEGDHFSACSPLGTTATCTLIAASGAPRIPKVHCFFLPHFMPHFTEVPGRDCLKSRLVAIGV